MTRTGLVLVLFFVLRPPSTDAVLNFGRESGNVGYYKLLARSAQEQHEFESARKRAREFQSLAAGRILQNLRKIHFVYLIYAKTRGIDIRLDFTITIERTSLGSKMFRAEYRLGEVNGYGSLDGLIISLGKALGKVPDTRKELQAVLVLEDKGFRTRMLSETPSENFIRQWTAIVQMRNQLAELKSRQKAAKKALHLEQALREKTTSLWSPLLVEFDPNIKGRVRFLKNRLDDQAVWEERSIREDIESDLLTEFSNYMLWGSAADAALSAVFVHKKRNTDFKDENRPLYVFKHIQLQIFPFDEKEHGQKFPLNRSLTFGDDQSLSDFIDEAVYFRLEPEVGGIDGSVGARVPTLIYIETLTDPSSANPKKVLASDIRFYLSEARIETYSPDS